CMGHEAQDGPGDDRLLPCLWRRHFEELRDFRNEAVLENESAGLGVLDGARNGKQSAHDHVLDLTRLKSVQPVLRPELLPMDLAESAKNHWIAPGQFPGDLPEPVQPDVRLSEMFGYVLRLGQGDLGVDLDEPLDVALERFAAKFEIDRALFQLLRQSLDCYSWIAASHLIGNRDELLALCPSGQPCQDPPGCRLAKDPLYVR